MINYRLIFKIIGQLLFLEAILMAFCLAMAIGYEEDDILAFLGSTVITVFFALVLKILGKNADNSLSRRDAYLMVTMIWAVYSLQGTLPFIIGGYLTNFTDAYFEAMSGFTTTGASVIDNVEALPHGILFWRSLSQWVGALGIVFFTIALLPSMVGGSVRVFAAEMTGPFQSKLHPRLSTSAKWIWSMYLLLTLACMGCYWLCGMSVFDSANYAMSTAATGGFATHNGSMYDLHLPYAEYVCMTFAFLSGINFTLLYSSVIKLRPRQIVRNAEFRFYITTIIIFTIIIAWLLDVKNGYPIADAVRSALFSVVNCVTTTGFTGDSITAWPHVTWLILLACMWTGGCSGSTSGGIKCIRVVMAVKAVRNEFRQMLHPNAVLPMKIDGINVPMQKRVTLLAFMTIYALLAASMCVLLTLAGVDAMNILDITLSTMSNVGTPLGLAGDHALTWATLPVTAKWISIVMMLFGRLEVFSVLIIFTPDFWKRR